MQKRIITELGSGADLHGGDMTKAAKRAIEDALRHSSLSLFHGLKLKPQDMHVIVKVGAPDPGGVDADELAKLLVNRSASHYALSHFSAAHLDALAALAVAPLHPKALYRLSEVRMAHCHAGHSVVHVSSTVRRQRQRWGDRSTLLRR